MSFWYSWFDVYKGLPVVLCHVVGGGAFRSASNIILAYEATMFCILTSYGSMV